MKTLIHLYKNNPTADEVDGELISEGDDKSTPLTIALNATSNEESTPIKLAIRCEKAFVTKDAVTITPQGTTANKWALAPDNHGKAGVFGEYGASLELKDPIKDKNTIFWIKAKADDTEIPVKDETVQLVTQAKILAE